VDPEPNPEVDPEPNPEVDPEPNPEPDPDLDIFKSRILVKKHPDPQRWLKRTYF
jgi:hypothetical protein